ncbi:hypothetical protein C353_06781 [Cryptococcus neoformans AD1-83a]|nr:hypothetical protein C353_06781 [Cryptococcus neoformans var. grubii AD1-83a]
MAREVGKMERLAMENTGLCMMAVFGYLPSSSPSSSLVFTRLHPRLHCCLHPRLRPVPHAALEFILPITDSSTRLSLNTRRICSAAPPRPIHSLGYSFTPTCLFDIHWQ